MTKQKEINKQLQDITDKIVEEFKPEKIILFGSYAWGKPGRDSDIDLFVVKESKKQSLDRERELRQLLFGNNFPPMDILVYTPKELKNRLDLEDFFIKDILNKGKMLYAKQSI